MRPGVSSVLQMEGYLKSAEMSSCRWIVYIEQLLSLNCSVVLMGLFIHLFKSWGGKKMITLPSGPHSPEEQLHQ